MNVGDSLRIADYRLYEGPEGSTVLWLPKIVSFLILEGAHLEVIRAFPPCRPIVGDAYEAACKSGLIPELLEAGVLEEGKEEAFLKTSSFTPSIDAFRVVMTETCNFRCPGCFATTALSKSRRNLLTMKDKVVEQTFRSMIPYGRDNQILVQFFGGEPLIRFDSIRKAVGILNAAVEAGQMLQPVYTITTNGSIMNDSIIEFFLENNFQVGVSVEGASEVHDSVRVTATGKKTFDIVSAACDRLMSAGVDTHVLFTPYPEHQRNLSETFRYLLTRFPAKRITINTAFEQDNLAWQVIDQYAEQLVECEKIALKEGVEVDSALTPILSAISAAEARRSPQATIGNRVMVTVDPEGKVYRSSQRWGEDTLLIGSLENAQSHDFPVLRDSLCGVCEARSVCGGPNEEHQKASGRLLDEGKCRFHKRAIAVLAKNMRLFEQPEEQSN